MSKTELSKEEYLRKYISGNVSKKSKKDKHNQSISRMKIIEDDLDLKSLELQVNDVDDDEFLDPDCQPSVAEVIDDRPFDKRGTDTKWKKINEANDSTRDKDRIKRSAPPNCTSQNNTQKRKQEVVGNSLSRRQQNNSDRNIKPDLDASPPRRQRHDSDTSPPRRQRHDSDISPPRRQRHDSDTSPPRRQRHDSDASPPRRQRHDSDTSPPRRKENRKKDYFSHNSQSRDLESTDVKEKLSKTKNASSRDKSNVEKNGSSHSNVNSSLCNNKHTSHRASVDKGSDLNDSRRNNSFSPTSKHSKTLNRNLIQAKEEPISDCEDNSRVNSANFKHTSSFTDKNSFDNKKSNRHSKDKNHQNAKGKESDSKSKDNRLPSFSPKRKFDDRDGSRENVKYRNSKVSNRVHISSSASESENDKSNLPTKTLSGVKAGLSSASELKAEMKKKRMDEVKQFDKLDAELLGKNAKTVVRSGKRPKELTSEEKKDLADKEEERKKIQSKYDKWSRGLKQISEQERRVDEDTYEMSKPLARYHGDKDLEKRLKDEVYEEEDPMASYILQKRTKKSKRKSDSDKESESCEKKKKKELPLYKGDAPPNRYGVRPGYRWDGVDRSNGFEKRYFEMMNKRKSTKVSAYKWSVEDM